MCYILHANTSKYVFYHKTYTEELADARYLKTKIHSTTSLRQSGQINGMGVLSQNAHIEIPVDNISQGIDNISQGVDNISQGVGNISQGVGNISQGVDKYRRA